MNIERYNKLKPTKELVNSLTNHNGILPTYLKIFANQKEYLENLKKNEAYEKVLENERRNREQYKFSNDRENYLEQELNNWLKDNPQFNKILNNSIKE